MIKKTALDRIPRYKRTALKEECLYRVFQLDLPQIKRLLGHQKCTFKSQKWYLYIHEMRNFYKKPILFTNFYVSGSQSLHIWQIHWVFCLIFAGIKTKTSQSSLYSTAFFKILKEPALVQKPTIPHMKALIFSYLEPEGWGHGNIMGAPCPPLVKLFVNFFSEVVEAKRVDFSKKKFGRNPKCDRDWVKTS